MKCKQFGQEKMKSKFEWEISSAAAVAAATTTDANRFSFFLSLLHTEFIYEFAVAVSTSCDRMRFAKTRWGTWQRKIPTNSSTIRRSRRKRRLMRLIGSKGIVCVCESSDCHSDFPRKSSHLTSHHTLRCNSEECQLTVPRTMQWQSTRW